MSKIVPNPVLKVIISFLEENPISVNLPTNIEGEIESTEGVVKGQTAASSYKPAKLDNGLTVMLNEDHNETSVFGAIVVDGGGKRDPKDATGIAHYLEHLLFKGTSKMGTVDYETEKIYLDSIEVLYDELASTKKDRERLKIQKEINSISIKS